jgi:hypothetical protein
MCRCRNAGQQAVPLHVLHRLLIHCRKVRRKGARDNAHVYLRPYYADVERVCAKISATNERTKEKHNEGVSEVNMQRCELSEFIHPETLTNALKIVNLASPLLPRLFTR